MKYQVMPALTEEEFSELKSDIAKRGVMIPIEFDEDGNVLDGHHRLRACEELGITDYPKVVREGMRESEKRYHARSVNVNRRQLTRKQINDLVKEQLVETPELSDRQIAKDLGVNNSTVSRTRDKMEKSGELLQSDTSKGADGKTRSRKSQNEKKEPVLVYDKEDTFFYAFYENAKDLKVSVKCNAVMVLRCEADEVGSVIDLMRSWGFVYASGGSTGRSSSDADGWLKERLQMFLVAVKGDMSISDDKRVKSYYSPASADFGKKLAEHWFKGCRYVELGVSA